ncbi:phage gpG-like protein [Hephaestia caeni]|uniref:Phage gpG-like protein n=1 Tax=Hephaestia caeni TaxID=645617 RepID=A0A397P6Y4_9SPHN|nr:phage virion morphogenesis protein [Hephaestia caeni]RIA44053.1 phage gpG-like protein [Hephaestia caeni]
MFRVIFNDRPIAEALRQAQATLDDMEPVFTDIGEYLVGATKDRFAASEAPDGSKWAPKSPTTLEHYRRMGDGDRPKPLIGPSRRLSTEIHAQATKAAVEVGSNLIYSGVMQGGAAKGAFGSDGAGRPIPWGNIPARVWLGLSETDERNILDIVDEAIAPALDGG